MRILKPTLIASIWMLSSFLSVAAETNAGQSAVRALLQQQEKDWNEGNIERFMQGYLKSDQTRFASGGTITLGWQAVLERYQRTYPDRSAMGRLTFSELDVSMSSDEVAVAFGRWHLKREKDELSGLFTLLLRKTPEGWRIFHDHTSAAERK